ncbi:MAG: hypothetical protein RIS24_1800 [Verrucomicrobiota bacterium]|jgi:hypothetical protein
MRAEVFMRPGIQKGVQRGCRFLTLFLAAAWLGSIPGFRSPLTAQSTAPAAVPRGKPIKPLAGEVKAVEPKGEASKPSVATNAPAAKPGFASVGFDVLATFKYEVPEDAPASKTNAPAADPDTQIPANVKAFSGKKVAVKGFMLPLKVEGGLVTELLLMRDQSMCCFGTVPKINEWIAVKMTTSGIKPVMDQAVTLYGTLKVGAMRENGYLVGIYQMDGMTIDGPPGS